MFHPAITEGLLRVCYSRYHVVSILSHTQPTTTNTDILHAQHHHKNILVIDMAGVENDAAEFVFQKQEVDLLIMMCCA